MTNERIFLSAPDISGDERALVTEVFDSNYVAPAGAMLETFEREMCEYTGFTHAVALASGTAALHLALHELNLQKGEEVWTTSMTFVGGVWPVSYVGAVPVFFDLAADSWTIDCDLLAEELEKANKSNALPRGIVTTDLYGQSCDMDRIVSMAATYGVPVISDSAEALGAWQNGKHAGKGASSAVLSFNGNKIITSSGGGMLLSDDKALIDRCRYLSTQARQPTVHYEHTEMGFNYRLSNVCAAIGLGQLRMIEQKVARRREIFERYKAALGSLSGVQFMPEPEGYRSTRWLTCIDLGPDAKADRFELQKACDDALIEARPLWKPMHMQPVFEGTRFVGPGVSENLFATGMCLPSGSGMSDAQQDRVIDLLTSHLG